MYKMLMKQRAFDLVEQGATREEAARVIGVSSRTIYRWLAERRTLCESLSPSVSSSRKGKEEDMDDSHLYEPPRSGPLAGLEPAQIENLLLRAVLADLKAEGWVPDSISNRSKCELGERLRLATDLPLRSITAFLKISKSSYEYHRARLGHDKYADLRREVRTMFEAGGCVWGYRTIWARLRRTGIFVSEKVVRRIMREEGCQVLRAKRSKKYCSYKGEITDAPANLVKRRFRADAPNKLWLTDMTEFALPSGEKVYLNPIIDCFDGKPVSWEIGRRPTKALAEGSLAKALKSAPGAHPIIHSDRGIHYRTPSWISMCDGAGIVRSMSRKGCCGDNSACEGFFGRLKNEFYHGKDWRGVSAEEFMEMLGSYLRYYCEGRIKKSLGWLSPDEYRRSLGFAV